MDYQSAADIIAEHRRNCGKYKGIISKVDPDLKRLQNETRLKYCSDARCQSYHLELFGNEIITFGPGGLMVDDCGWFSRTTHLRLNEYLPKGFRIYTAKFMYLSGIRTLGFIKTPFGTYPYNMPMSFTYDGETYGSSAYTSHAREAMAKVPKYVDENLNRLLHHKPFEHTAPNNVFDPDVGDVAWLSSHLAQCILENVQLSCLAQASLDHAVNTDDYNGIFVDDIVRVLLASGHDAFKEAATKNEQGRKMEHTIEHRLPMITIPARWIRKTLRPLMLEYIVDSLGFKRAEWNRRENVNR